MRRLKGEDLKTIRYVLGMSQQDFSLIVGMSQPLISLVEAGTRRLTEDNNTKIHKAVLQYIDKETLYKILDGEIEI